MGGKTPSQRMDSLLKHNIVDIYETSEGYIVLTDKGRELVFGKDLGRKIYWDIKKRNRRKAFGL